MNEIKDISISLDQESMLRSLWKEIQSVNNVTMSRLRRDVIYRHCFFVCARELSTISLQAIANIQGQNHATVLHAVKNHEASMMYDQKYLVVYDAMHSKMSDMMDINKQAVMNVLEARLSISSSQKEAAEATISEMYQAKLRKDKNFYDKKISELNAEITHFKKYSKQLHTRNRLLSDECLRLKNLI